MPSSLPALASELDWPALHAGPATIWLPTLQILGLRWGLLGAWERLPGGEDSVVFAQADTVVKLVPPFEATSAHREARVLNRLRLPVLSPRVHEVVEIDGWVALRMTRLPGRRIGEVWSEIAPGAQRELLGRMGELLAAIWATETDADDGDPPAFLDRLRQRAERHAAEVPLGALLAPARHVTGPAVLLHLDLNDGNVLVESVAGRWRISGVLDLVASRAGFPPLDLVTPGVFFVRGDPDHLRALCDGASLWPSPDELVAWHLLHPFSNLRRDRDWAGTDTLEAMWRRTPSVVPVRRG